MSPKTWQEWFEQWGEYGVHAAYFECNADFTVEDLFQMFKARLEGERAAGLKYCGRLNEPGSVCEFPKGHVGPCDFEDTRFDWEKKR